MKYDNKEELKERAINLYLNGKTMQEISKILKCSRNYVGTIIKNDRRVKEYRNTKIVKVYKYRNTKKMYVPISVSFLGKIGISIDVDVDDFVKIEIKEKENTIIIKKVLNSDVN